MRYELDRPQWDLVVTVLRRDGSPEAVEMADDMEAWLKRCDVSWEMFEVAMSKVPRRQRRKEC